MAKGYRILWTLISVYFLFALASGINNPFTLSRSSTRKDRFFTLFTIVRFANDLCTGSDGYNGTCYKSTECSAKGGYSSGTCASGFGVCCIVVVSSCGSTTASNVTYWQNPGYPSTYSGRGICTLDVKTASDTCQLRLDFNDFTLAQPDSTAADVTGGQCLTDVFIVSGQANSVPSICGINKNQHIYLDVSPSDTISLSVVTSGTNTSRLWNIQVGQIPCVSSLTAPDRCLQWFTEPYGTITSFNYQYASNGALQHLANQDYTICIRTNKGFCGIAYSVCATPPEVLGYGISPSLSGVNSAIEQDCDNNDWLHIPCGTTTADSTIPCVFQFCGDFLNVVSGSSANAPVYSFKKPFNLRFHTTSKEDGTNEVSTGGSTGFCLDYKQKSCTSGG